MFHDVYQIMKTDNYLYDAKVFYLSGGAIIFCFLNKEAKVDEICLLKPKDLLYISIKGNDCANCYLLSVNFLLNFIKVNLH